AADALVVLGAPVAPRAQGGQTDAPSDAGVVAARLALLAAAQELSEGVVLADGPAGPGSLTAAVLADSEVAGSVSTVTGTDKVVGQVSVPLALAARIGGTVGHYGFSTADETLFPPPVTLVPPDRTPRDDDDGGTGTEAGTGASDGADGTGDGT